MKYRPFTKEEDRKIQEAWLEQRPHQKVGGAGIFDTQVGMTLGRSKGMITYRRGRIGLRSWTKRKKYARKSTQQVIVKTVKAVEPKACYCRFCGNKVDQGE